MAIIIRITAVLGAIWSALILGLLATAGTLMTFTDWFDHAHTQKFVSIVSLLEVGLLVVLWHAGKMRVLAAPMILLWFVIVSGLLNDPFVMSNWPHLLWGMMVCFLPVTLTMVLLPLHGVVTFVRARYSRPQTGTASPQPL